MDAADHKMQHQQQLHTQQQQQQQQKNNKHHNTKANSTVPLAHNGQNCHIRRNSKVPVRELPNEMPSYQHRIYPQLYLVNPQPSTCYKWDCIILDLDRTIIHGKRLSVKRWRKYVENGTIPSLAENQCGKWHRHIHRKGHQMHPFIRGRTMIYYRPFTWHLLAVLDYLKSHFGTKIIVCTKAGEHYAASVLAALISNFTSANPNLIDDVYNFHDLHDDINDEGKPKKPFRLICNRHNLDATKTLIVDDNATSWFAADREITNFWMPPCYGYQIHDIDNELQLLCKYLWDPIQQNHLKKKHAAQQQPIKLLNNNNIKLNKPLKPPVPTTNKSISVSDSSINSSPKMIKSNDIINVSPKSLSRSNNINNNVSSTYLSPKNVRNISPKNKKNSNVAAASNLKMHKSLSSVSSSYSIKSINDNDIITINDDNNNPIPINISKIQIADLLDGADDCNKEPKPSSTTSTTAASTTVTSISRISRSYNKRKYKGNDNNDPNVNNTSKSKTKSPKNNDQTRTKKKNYFFETKSRGSKKLAKIIGK